MKSLFRIIRRYSLSAIGIVLIILFCNFSILLYNLYQSVKDDHFTSRDGRIIMEEIGQQLKSDGGVYHLSEKGKEILEDTPYAWAMALDEKGGVVWEWKVPDQIPKQYSLFQVASFSRWYLKDYPVRVWHVKDLLLVFAYDKEDMVVYSSLVDRSTFERLPANIRRFVLGNLFVFLGVVLLFAYRFYASLRPISEGIESLSQKKPIHLKEKGSVRELAQKINATSRILQRQEEKLSRRDQARTDWIAGVSHDIRTPLTLIMGYAEKLEENEALSVQDHAMVNTIKRQSELIRQLIADLNLASKLSDDTFPLHRTVCLPAQMLRECVADLYNAGLEEQFSIDLLLSEATEQITFMGDESLLKRAMRNILGNCIRHNPEGCRVTVSVDVSGRKLKFLCQDTGKGIPESIVRCLEQEEEAKRQDMPVSRENQPHIMGMRITGQIIRLHGGRVDFKKRESGTFDYRFWLPVQMETETYKETGKGVSGERVG